jgi:hypothetical protein
VAVEDTASYVPMGPTATSVALGIAREYAIETKLEVAEPEKPAA